MTIASAVCNTFKMELLESKHDFANGGDSFKIALFTSSASLGAATANYSTTNEITNTSGSAYVAGGQALAGQSVTGGSGAAIAFVDWSTNPQWTTASFTANGAMIYNTTTDGGTSTTNTVCIIAFGSDFTASNGTFTITFPAADTTNAILRLS